MNVATGMRVVATRPVDFRKGHDGLAAVVEHELGLDPYSGVALVFRPKRMNRVKVLWVGGVHSIAYGDPLPEAKSDARVPFTSAGRRRVSKRCDAGVDLPRERRGHARVSGGRF